MLASVYIPCDGEKCIFLLCAWKVGSLKSGHKYISPSCLSPVTSIVTLLLAFTGEFIVPHTGVVLNCKMYKTVYTIELSIVVDDTLFILLISVPLLLHTISTLLVIPLTVVTSHCSVSD